MQYLWTLVLILTSFFSGNLLAQSEVNSVQNKQEQSTDKDKPLSVNDMPSILQKFKSDSTETREYFLGKISEAYLEDTNNPALKLENMWVNDKGTLLEVNGLRRNGNKYSAVIDLSTLQLLNIKSNQSAKYLMHVGGQEVDSGNSKILLQLQPGERLFLFFDPIDDFQPHSLRYTNWVGKADNYFDRIDPLFKKRYDSAYEKASNRESSVEDMRSFLMEFARNDSEKRAQKIFVDLINKLRTQNTFEGYLQSYQLVKDPADERAAAKLARSPDQQSKLAVAVALVKKAEAAKEEELRKAQEAKFAEIRKREEALVAERRKQDEVKQAQMRVTNAAEDEERCMRTPSCRNAWQAEQARCVSQIQSCRGNCDRVSSVGSTSSFFGGLVASGMARVCYGACKCGSGFGELLGKFNNLASENTSKSRPSQSSTANAIVSTGMKIYQCKIYCKSASGPVTYKKVEAQSRREAAKIIGDSANQICADDGKSYASGRNFSESQCSEQ